MTEYHLREAAKAYLEATPPPRSRKGTVAWDALRAAIADSEAAGEEPRRDFRP